MYRLLTFTTTTTPFTPESQHLTKTSKPSYHIRCRVIIFWTDIVCLDLSVVNWINGRYPWLRFRVGGQTKSLCKVINDTYRECKENTNTTTTKLFPFVWLNIYTAICGVYAFISMHRVKKVSVIHHTHTSTNDSTSSGYIACGQSATATDQYYPRSNITIHNDDDDDYDVPSYEW